ncbi:hypothetical protein D3C72_1972330 [compost metagenome]
MTFAPSAASWRAMPAPMPFDAPVIKATLSFNLLMSCDSRIGWAGMVQLGEAVMVIGIELFANCHFCIFAVQF